jgi:hypothetical protein
LTKDKHNEANRCIFLILIQNEPKKMDHTKVNIIAFTVFTFLEYKNLETARLWGVTFYHRANYISRGIS